MVLKVLLCSIVNRVEYIFKNMCIIADILLHSYFQDVLCAVGEEFASTPDTHHCYKYQNLSSIMINEVGNSPKNTLQIISQLLYVRLWE